MNFEPGEIRAVFQAKSNGHRKALRATIGGGLYGEYLDYDGLFAGGATFSFNRNRAKWWAEDVRDGDLTVIQSPQTLYHVWHICFCAECEPWGGRIWDHSQGTWDSHFRTKVEPSNVFTFPTV